MSRASVLCVLGLAIAATLPVAGAWFRPLPTARCARDGVALESAPIATVIDAAGAHKEFCSIACADAWAALRARSVARIVVRDADTGAEIDAADAWYVRSSIVVSPATGDRVHAFSSRSAAESHAAAFRGMLLPSGELPFQVHD